MDLAVSRKKVKRLHTTSIIMLGFLISAALGSLLLCLPISLKKDISISYIDALFTAVTSVCVTGLSTINIGQTFSAFGQVIILILIQFGGLGIVTFTTLVLIGFRRRITLSERLLIQNAYNVDTLTGLVRLTFKILKATFAIEGAGALCYALVFVPEYGLKGIWYSLFTAVSAFCNAGIDLFGGNSLCAYVNNPIVNITTILLIILSGLGFPVYWDVLKTIKYNRENNQHRYFSKLTMHSKLVLVVTLILIIVGFASTLLLEYNNPDTLGSLSVGNRLMSAMFQSVTLRTAGFATIDQSLFRSSSCGIYLLLMFIGGSPAGTAGGVKTVTMALMLASMISNIRGKKQVTLFNRTVSDASVRRAVAIVMFSFSTLFLLTIALLAAEGGDFLDTLYEMTSAVATVGLSRGLTGELGMAGKIIVILAMYLGRIGPITLALAFNSNARPSGIRAAESKVSL
jgi:trk system potassium uptake protein TrkH